MHIAPLLWLMQTLPECLALASLAVVLASGRLAAKNILLIGFLLAVAVYLVRLLPLAFGIHFIIFIVILALLLAVRLKLRLSRCLFIALVANLILAVTETLSLYFLSLLTGVPFDQATGDFSRYLLYGWPHIVLLFFIALVIQRWRTGRAGKMDSHG